MLGENFTFDGIDSTNFGVKMVRVGESGFIPETIIGDGSITEVEHRADFKPQFQRMSRSPIEFNKQIVLLDEQGNAKKWTEQDRLDIFSWLFHSEYKPLIFEDRPEVVYYVIATSNLTLNTMNERGYIDITFRSNSPYPFRPERVFTLTGGVGSAAERVINIEAGLAIDKIFPVIELERVGTSSTVVQAWVSTSQPALDIGPANTIGLMNNDITEVSKIRINTKYRSIIDMDTGKSLYGFKSISEQTLNGDRFPFLIEGRNTIFISQGWKATIYINEPIIY